MRCVSAALKAVTPATATGTRCPLNSTCGGRPGEMMRSLTFLPMLSIASMMVIVGTAGAACAAAAGAAVGVVAMVPLDVKSDAGGRERSPAQVARAYQKMTGFPGALRVLCGALFCR